MTDLTLLTISGSLRAGSVNSKLLAEAARLFQPHDLIVADLNLPLYDGDVETGSGIPTSVSALADRMRQADAIAISTPEYNKGIPGVLKNALDWVSRTEGPVMQNKPVALMSAAAGRAGGESAQFMLRSCLVSFRPRLVTGPFVAVAQAGSAFDEDGHLTSDRYLADLTELMSNLRSEAASV